MRWSANTADLLTLFPAKPELGKKSKYLTLRQLHRGEDIIQEQEVYISYLPSITIMSR